MINFYKFNLILEEQEEQEQERVLIPRRSKEEREKKLYTCYSKKNTTIY